MHVMYKGVRVELKITGMAEVVSRDGSRSLHIRVTPVIPDPGGPGEPLPLPSAA